MPFCHSGVGHNLAGLPPITDFPFRDLPLEGEHTGLATPTDLRGARAATAGVESGESGNISQRARSVLTFPRGCVVGFCSDHLFSAL